MFRTWWSMLIRTGRDSSTRCEPNTTLARLPLRPGLSTIGARSSPSLFHARMRSRCFRLNRIRLRRASQWPAASLPRHRCSPRLRAIGGWARGSSTTRRSTRSLQAMNSFLQARYAGDDLMASLNGELEEADFVTVARTVSDVPELTGMPSSPASGRRSSTAGRSTCSLPPSARTSWGAASRCSSASRLPPAGWTSPTSPTFRRFGPRPPSGRRSGTQDPRRAHARVVRPDDRARRA